MTQLIHGIEPRTGTQAMMEASTRARVEPAHPSPAGSEETLPLWRTWLTSTARAPEEQDRYAGSLEYPGDIAQLFSDDDIRALPPGGVLNTLVALALGFRRADLPVEIAHEIRAKVEERGGRFDLLKHAAPYRGFLAMAGPWGLGGGVAGAEEGESYRLTVKPPYSLAIEDREKTLGAQVNRFFEPGRKKRDAFDVLAILARAGGVEVRLVPSAQSGVPYEIEALDSVLRDAMTKRPAAERTSPYLRVEATHLPLAIAQLAVLVAATRQREGLGADAVVADREAIRALAAETS